jgi:hypothetical protein
MKRLLLIAALAAGLPALARATTLDFEFSFTNFYNGGGAVTGIVRGLQDDAVNEVVSLEVLTNAAGFGVGRFTAPSIRRGEFTVSAGMVTSALFRSFGNANAAFGAGSVTSSSISIHSERVPGGMDGPRAIVGSLSNFPHQVTTFSKWTKRPLVTFTRLDAPPDVPPPPPPPVVPLPAAGWMLLAGMAALLGVRRRMSS